MQTVRIRTAPRKYEQVQVVQDTCPLYKCFYYAREHHTSLAGYSGRSAWTGDRLVCKRNEARGCPEDKIMAYPPIYERTTNVRGGWAKVE